MSASEKKSILVRDPLLSYYLMSCAFLGTAVILLRAIVVGALNVDPSAQPWTVWIVTILGASMHSLSVAIVVRAPQGPEAVSDLLVKPARIKLLTCPTAEEPGWRGFALPRPLERYSPLKAGLD